MEMVDRQAGRQHRPNQTQARPAQSVDKENRCEYSFMQKKGKRKLSGKVNRAKDSKSSQ